MNWETQRRPHHHGLQRELSKEDVSRPVVGPRFGFRDLSRLAEVRKRLEQAEAEVSELRVTLSDRDRVCASDRAGSSRELWPSLGRGASRPLRLAAEEVTDSAPVGDRNSNSSHGAIVDNRITSGDMLSGSAGVIDLGARSERAGFEDSNNSQVAIGSGATAFSEEKWWLLPDPPTQLASASPKRRLRYRHGATFDAIDHGEKEIVVSGAGGRITAFHKHVLEATPQDRQHLHEEEQAWQELLTDEKFRRGGPLYQHRCQRGARVSKHSWPGGRPLDTHLRTNRTLAPGTRGLAFRVATAVAKADENERQRSEEASRLRQQDIDSEGPVGLPPACMGTSSRHAQALRAAFCALLQRKDDQRALLDLDVKVHELKQSRELEQRASAAVSTKRR